MRLSLHYCLVAIALLIAQGCAHNLASLPDASLLTGAPPSPQEPLENVDVPVGENASLRLDDTGAEELAFPPPEIDHLDTAQSAAVPAEDSLPAIHSRPPAPHSHLFSSTDPSVWGVLGLRLFPYGEHVASNGVEFNQLFSLDLDFNIWIWPQQGLYLFSDARFWGQKAAPGITNSSQGVFDFSKREFDMLTGLAWNYWRYAEVRAFAYSFNNLNRGSSAVRPSGFNDGVGLENRFYLNEEYASLGTTDFDPARSTYVGFGFYPSKSMVDGTGVQFRPGPFVKVFLTCDICGPTCYLYTYDQLLATRTFQAKQFTTDSGIAYRPFVSIPRLEFRLGSEDTFDLDHHENDTSVYVKASYIF